MELECGVGCGGCAVCGVEGGVGDGGVGQGGEGCGADLEVVDGIDPVVELWL